MAQPLQELYWALVLSVRVASRREAEVLGMARRISRSDAYGGLPLSNKCLREAVCYFREAVCYFGDRIVAFWKRSPKLGYAYASSWVLRTNSEIERQRKKECL
ncbi:hypothetical protein [Nostoc sp.]